MKQIALLRGINVGGHRRVPMAELRALVNEKIGSQARTYIQSGNLVFVGETTAEKAEAALERAIEQHFGFSVVVMVRSEAQWMGYLQNNPFRDAARDRPKQLHLCVCKKPPLATAGKMLVERAILGERVERLPDALFIDFVRGVGMSKLTPAALDRAAGSCVTARNWATVNAIAELLAE